MTDLLSRATSAPSQAATDPCGTLSQGADPRSARRSLSTRAALAGLAAVLGGLALCWLVALAGWYSSDGGSHGTTRSALRVGADAWLLAHDSHLTTRDATVSAAPLGLTLLLAWLAHRAGRWAGRSSQVEDLSAAGHGTIVLSGVYAVLALVTGLLASADGAEPGAMRAFAGGLVLSGLTGGWGLVSGAGLGARVRAWFPVSALSAAYGAVVTLALLMAAAGGLVALSLALHADVVGNLVGRIGGGMIGAAFTTLLCLALLPNAVLLGSAYLLGPGFALGSGTVVSPGEVVLGQLPAVPLLAAVPEHALPGWAAGVLVGVPLGIGGLGAWYAGRRLPTRSWVGGALRGAAGGIGAALLLGSTVAQAGGAVGSGRMTDIGAHPWPVLATGMLTLGLGGGLGGLAGSWAARRAELADVVNDERPDVRPVLAQVLAQSRSRVRSAALTAWDRPPTLGRGRHLTPDPDPDPESGAGEATVALRVPDQPR